jgi:hypothetical protein
MKRHQHHPPLPRRSRREELTALHRDLAFAIGVIADVLRGRPFAS